LAKMALRRSNHRHKFQNQKIQQGKRNGGKRILCFLTCKIVVPGPLSEKVQSMAVQQYKINPVAMKKTAAHNNRSVNDKLEYHFDYIL
ncbi:hypothetical protein T06_13955, partial [Trichinella sp. T6]